MLQRSGASRPRLTPTARLRRSFAKEITDPIPVSNGAVPGIFFTGTPGPDYWYNYHVYKKGRRLYYVFIFAPKIADFGRAQTKIKSLNDSFKIS